MKIKGFSLLAAVLLAALLIACNPTQPVSAPARQGEESISQTPGATPSAAPAITPKPPMDLDYRIDGNEVVILEKGNDIPVARIPFDGDDFTEDNSGYFVQMCDMDFDGFMDVQVLFSQGLRNTFYDCWLWSPEEKKFIKNEELSELPLPSFDGKNKRITSFTAISAAEYVEDVYTFNGGKLAPFSSIEQVYNPDEDNFTISTYEAGADGNLKLVTQETLSEQELLARQQMDLEPALEDFPAGSRFVDSMLFPDGSWWQLQSGASDSIEIESWRWRCDTDQDEKGLKALVKKMNPNALSLKITPYDDAENTALPALSVSFNTKKNANTLHHEGVCFMSGAWYFWIDISTPLNLYAAGARGANEGAAPKIKEWLTSASIQEKSTESITNEGIPYYVEDSMLSDPPEGDISLFDALLCVRRNVRPQLGGYAADTKFAYRYDGIIELNRAEWYQISFGEDTAEKFTAERHFAVSGKGKIMELDVLSNKYLPV